MVPLLYLVPSKYLFLPSSRAHSSEMTFYAVIRATRRSSHSQGKGSTQGSIFISKLFLLKNLKVAFCRFFSPDFTLNSQIRLFHAEKWIFLKNVGPLLRTLSVVPARGISRSAVNCSTDLAILYVEFERQGKGN